MAGPADDVTRDSPCCALPAYSDAVAVALDAASLTVAAAVDSNRRPICGAERRASGRAASGRGRDIFFLRETFGVTCFRAFEGGARCCRLRIAQLPGFEPSGGRA